MRGKTMKAAVVTTPGTLEIQQIPVPEISEYEALVKIEVCGLCGTTDRHIIAGNQAHHPSDWYPAVLGHEAVGTVVELGSKVKKYKVGDRVSRPVAVWPGTQKHGLYSAWGGFAEYGLVKDREALLEAGQDEYENDYTALRQNVVPQGLGSVEASLAISLAEAYSWVKKLGHVEGKTVVVGGAGMFGIAIANFLKLAGAATVIVISRRDEALKHVSKIADATVNSSSQDVKQEVAQATGGSMADVFVEATGVDEVFDMGLGLIKPGGLVAIYGAPVGYQYSLKMKSGPGDFSVRLIPCDDHIEYASVCGLLLENKLETSFYISHKWDGLASLPVAIKLQAAGEVRKGCVEI